MNNIKQELLLEMFSRFVKFNDDRSLPSSQNAIRSFDAENSLTAGVKRASVQFQLGNHLCEWIINSKLHRNMQRLLERSPQSEVSNDENFWSLYWYKIWQKQPDSLAKEHLWAYLQQPCLWSASKIAEIIQQQTNSVGIYNQYSLPECFQLAIAEIDKLLRQFNLKLGYNLKTYAYNRFKSILRDKLRESREIYICTDWALLRGLNRTRLEDSLWRLVDSKETIAKYILAWECFQEIYRPSPSSATRRLERPDSTTWDEIAQLYNARRLHQLNPPGAECQPQTIETWLLYCVKAERNRYRMSIPTFVIDKVQPGEDGGNLVRDLPATEHESVLAEIITEEEEQSQKAIASQIKTVFTEALAQLNPENKLLLSLRYSQQLNQTEIGNQLGIKQYQVSRNIRNIKRSLLMVLGKWSQEHLQVTLTSNKLDELNSLLEELLTDHFEYQPSA